jgi:hypothetical protein
LISFLRRDEGAWWLWLSQGIQRSRGKRGSGGGKRRDNALEKGKEKKREEKRREEKRREEKRRGGRQRLVWTTTRRFGPSWRGVWEALDGIDIDDNRKEIVHVVLSV